MKTVYFVIEKETNEMLGAYPSYDMAEFESIVMATSNPFHKSSGLIIRKKEDVPDSIYDHLMVMTFRNLDKKFLDKN